MKKLFALLLVAGLAVPVLAEDKPKPKPDPEANFAKMDKDGDKKLSKEEFFGKRKGDKLTAAEETFKKKDKDADGFLTLEEYKGPGKKK